MMDNCDLSRDVDDIFELLFLSLLDRHHCKTTNGSINIIYWKRCFDWYRIEWNRRRENEKCDVIQCESTLMSINNVITNCFSMLLLQTLLIPGTSLSRSHTFSQCERGSSTYTLHWKVAVSIVTEIIPNALCKVRKTRKNFVYATLSVI